MLVVGSAVLAMVVLMALNFRQTLACIELIEHNRIQAPKPNPIFVTRHSKQFMDFVLLGKYRSSSDVEVLRSFGRLRAIICIQLAIFGAVFVYVILTFWRGH
jgi:hypothetical protein